MSLSLDERRVVVTGLGVVTPLGHDMESLWRNLLAGQCAVDRITAFDPTGFDCQIAAEIRRFDPGPAFLSSKEVRRVDRFVQLAVYAAHQALLDSGLDLDRTDRDEVGVYIGSGKGGLTSFEQEHKRLVEGLKHISPFVIPRLILNMGAGIFSIHHGLRGPNLAHCSACATGNHSIGEAWRTLKMGDAQVMFAGGAEASIGPLAIGGFCAMKALSTRNQTPQRASTPFDRTRDGFVMGEGAGVLVLEELRHAQSRGARIYCEILGYGNTADANHLTAPAPDGEGAARCMRMALRSARLNPEHVSYINAHGTSTPHGDRCETRAIKAAFGPHARNVAISSIKGATGHLLAAAGAVEMAVCAKAIQESIIPPTLNYHEPDPDCDLDYVPNTPRERPVEIALNNSFGFGGHNACLVAARLCRGRQAAG